MLNWIIPKRRKNGRDLASDAALNTAIEAVAVHTPYIAAVLQSVGTEVLSRRLSESEESRVQRTLALAASRVNDELRLGREPRSDGFLTGEPGDRSFADEIAEGVLLTVQREHEELKLPLFAEFLKNCVFDVTIDRASAVGLLALADALTYRQLCILALVVDRTLSSSLNSDLRFRVQMDEPDTKKATVWMSTFSQELSDLERRRLIEVASGLIRMPTIVTPTTSGSVLAEALGLSRLDRASLAALERRAYKNYRD